MRGHKLERLHAVDHPEIWHSNVLEILSAVAYVFPTAGFHLLHTVTVLTVADGDSTIPVIRWCAFTSLHGIIILIS